MPSSDGRYSIPTSADLPIIMSSISEAPFRTRLQMSMVNTVELELKMEVREDMRADSITASMMPLAPGHRKI